MEFRVRSLGFGVEDSGLGLRDQVVELFFVWGVTSYHLRWGSGVGVSSRVVVISWEDDKV